MRQSTPGQQWHVVGCEPADTVAQYRVLAPEYQQFGLFGRLTPGQHHQAGEQIAHDQVDISWA